MHHPCRGSFLIDRFQWVYDRKIHIVSEITCTTRKIPQKFSGSISSLLYAPWKIVFALEVENVTNQTFVRCRVTKPWKIAKAKIPKTTFVKKNSCIIWTQLKWKKTGKLSRDFPSRFFLRWVVILGMMKVISRTASSFFCLLNFSWRKVSLLQSG